METIVIIHRDGSRERIRADKFDPKRHRRNAPLAPPPLDELAVLKAEADRLGIAYGHSVGIATLKARIARA